MIHNSSSEIENDPSSANEKGDAQKEFVDVAMTVDENIFEEDPEDIEEGQFVSFRYLGETKGIPLHSKISSG